MQIAIPANFDDIETRAGWFITKLTIFVAFGPPADNGLDGTLSVCVLPQDGDWVDVSLLHKLEKYYTFTTIYLDFKFYTWREIHFGLIRFSEKDSDAVNDMTFGGQIILQD